MTPGAVPLMLYCATNLYHDDLKREVDGLRWQRFEYLGVPLPEVIVRCDPALENNSISIRLYQEPVMTLVLPHDDLLLQAPSAQLESRTEILPHNMGELHSIPVAQKERAITLGLPYAEGRQRIMYCLKRVLERHTSEFIGVQETRYLMDAMEGRYAELVKELQRQMPVGKIT